MVLTHKLENRKIRSVILCENPHVTNFVNLSIKIQQFTRYTHPEKQNSLSSKRETQSSVDSLCFVDDDASAAIVRIAASKGSKPAVKMINL